MWTGAEQLAQRGAWGHKTAATDKVPRLMVTRYPAVSRPVAPQDDAMCDARSRCGGNSHWSACAMDTKHAVDD